MSLMVSTIGKRAASPASELVVSPKRQKTSDSSSSTTIERSELDSALALASLALDSPKTAVVSFAQHREADYSPKVFEDEPRSGPAPVTPLESGNKRKRVHFSAEDANQSETVTQATRLIRRRRPMIVPQRSFPMPRFPHYPQHQRMSMPMPMPPPYRHPFMFRHWMSPARPFHHLPFHGPPPHVLNSSQNTWICDYCNIAAFTNYHDACAHEEVCKRHNQKYGDHQQTRQPEDKSRATECQDQEAVRDDDDDDNWFSGSVSLSVEPADSEWLSEMNCFIRKYCIEAFSATNQDVLKTSKRGRIVINQVGMRCKLCAHRPLADKAVAAVSYPTSMAGIYESVKRWQRVHLPACLDVTDDIQSRLDQLQNDSVWVPTTRQYWTDSAVAVGMVDTADGIRFGRNPTIPPPENWMPEASTTSSTDESMSDDQQQVGGYICFPGDKEMVPPYVYFLMRQVEPCYFTEADRFVARSKGPVGFAGFQCRHCVGHAGLGKYFPVNSKALSTNSTSQNIHAHLLKCRKTPQHLKEELLFLKSEKVKSPRLVPGWRKTFFEQVWERLHGDKVNLEN